VSDLTQEPSLVERLAAKLEGETESTGETDWLLLYRVDSWLPLLLSEPELVASLPDAVRLSVLNKRELAVMRHGEAVYAHNVLLRGRWNDFDALEKSDEEIRSSMRALQVLAHDAALTTEDFNE
jgi:hypothetical protein